MHSAYRSVWVLWAVNSQLRLHSSFCALGHIRRTFLVALWAYKYGEWPTKSHRVWSVCVVWSSSAVKRGVATVITGNGHEDGHFRITVSGTRHILTFGPDWYWAQLPGSFIRRFFQPRNSRARYSTIFHVINGNLIIISSSWCRQTIAFLMGRSTVADQCWLLSKWSKLRWCAFKLWSFRIRTRTVRAICAQMSRPFFMCFDHFDRCNGTWPSHYRWSNTRVRLNNWRFSLLISAYARPGLAFHRGRPTHSLLSSETLILFCLRFLPPNTIAKQLPSDCQWQLALKRRFVFSHTKNR